MNRITEIEIAGKKYPLNFSTKAAKEMAKRYGDISKIADAFTGKTAGQMMDEAIWILELLISQGVAYKQLAENEEIKGLAADELEVLLGLFEFADLKGIIFNAMNAGMKREVEVEIDSKNEMTTQNN